MNHKLITVLPEDLAECLPGIIDGLIIQKMQLFKHVYQVNLLLWSLILFNHLAVFLIKLLYFNSLAFLLLNFR